MATRDKKNAAKLVGESSFRRIVNEVLLGFSISDFHGQPTEVDSSDLAKGLTIYSDVACDEPDAARRDVVEVAAVAAVVAAGA